MASTATHRAASQSPEEQVLSALAGTRERTLALVGHLSEEQLSAVHSPIMSPLAWDLGHIAAYEDLWLAHRHAGLELLRGDLAGVYDAFETPRAVRGDIDALGPEDAHAYMRQVRERVAAAIARGGVGDGTVCEMVIRHELQHTETMRQTMAIAGLLPAGEPPAGQPQRRARGGADAAGTDTLGIVPDDGPPPLAESAAEWVTIEAGPFELGAPETGFAYDNERPRHTVALDAFQIARRPVSAAAWTGFVADGGYERREWWSDEGWAWKEEHDITHHPSLAPAAAAGPDGAAGASTAAATAPACHVSWFEADAFARARGARLPSEAEWERAARSERAALAQVGRVWEWTGSVFGGYPGFVARPYREYSEVFFDRGYFVLRGGSWATDERVKTRTFRNWDLPQRRQIFAGVRLARDPR
jgi:gamma-glutamyl hercynylcysteine S-oxide synthase